MFWCKNDGKIQNILEIIEEVGKHCLEISNDSQRALSSLSRYEQKQKNLELSLQETTELLKEKDKKIEELEGQIQRLNHGLLYMENPASFHNEVRDDLKAIEARVTKLENDLPAFSTKVKHLEEACFHMISKAQNVVISLKERVEKLEEAQENFKHKNKHNKDRLATRHNCKEAQCPQPCST